LDIWPGRGFQLATIAKTRTLQLRSRQIDNRITVYKVGDLNVFPKPFLDLENHVHVHKVCVYEVYAHEIHAREVHACEMHVYEMYAHETYDHETQP